MNITDGDNRQLLHLCTVGSDVYMHIRHLFHGRTRTAYRCVWSGIQRVDSSTSAFRRDQTSTVLGYDRLRPWE